MPKKPPFNHFRKSCLSPSNGNKKKKKELQVPSVPCKGCACLSHRGKGSRRGVPGGPTSPFPEGRHLHVALEQLPAAKVAPRGMDAKGAFPSTPAETPGQVSPVPAGTPGAAAVPTQQRNPLAGHTRSHFGSHSVSIIPFCIQPCSCCWGCCGSCRACGQGTAQPGCRVCWGTQKEPVCKHCHEEGTSQ